MFSQGMALMCTAGTLNAAAVVSVFAEGRAGCGGRIFHALEAQPPFGVGDTVACKVDAAHRERSARTHSAGHLIDVAMQRVGVTLEPTKGYHWPSGAYVEYADPPETRMSAPEREALLPRLQAALDELRAEDAPTTVEADAAGTRIVTIGGLACPCGGTHVPSAVGAAGIEASAAASLRERCVARGVADRAGELCAGGRPPLGA
jgi:Ser-tRNA(Ala) deacylase AlaX